MGKFFLYGPSASGKSTTGEHLAASLDLPFIDLDSDLEAAAGKPIPDIFASLGEDGFRELETKVLHSAVQKPGEAVVALGGGALLSPENRASAEANGQVLCLRAAENTIISRTSADKTIRPLLAEDPQVRIRAYLATRQEHYDSFSQQLQTDSLSPDEAALKAQTAFGAFRLRSMGRPYDVRVLRQGLADLGEMMQARSMHGPVCVVADSNTELHARTALESLIRAGYQAAIHTIPAGEVQKTVQTVQQLWDAFLSNGLERRSTVVAVGGGVVTDLAGFAAAAYLRGVNWVAVPTSLLGMVDASIGGKTGADLPQGKNLVGAFHPPGLVLADPDVLKTLPPRELRAGQAEMVKAGVIASKELFEAFLEPDISDKLPVWIPVSIGVKVELIETDPFEAGPRGRLNFGHTIGHAVEHASGYSLLHGEAIAIGMALESRLGEDIGYTQIGTSKEIQAVLTGIGLPIRIPDSLPRSSILAAMQLDKKKQAGTLRFALPNAIGSVDLVEVPPDAYRRCIGA